MVELNRDELDLLAWNVANEVVNGFTLEHFTATIGAPVEAFKELAARLRSVDNQRRLRSTGPCTKRKPSTRS